MPEPSKVLPMWFFQRCLIYKRVPFFQFIRDIYKALLRHNFTGSIIKIAIQ